MKIIQVTDVHLGPRERIRYGASQHDRLVAAIAEINARHADAALCVLTGDLTDFGDRAAYDDLAAELRGLTIPWRLLLGNHDRRDTFRAAFPDHPSEAFVHSVFDADGIRLVFLDTLAEGRVEGVLDGDRLAWLAARLDEAAGKRVLVFMHHPPVAIGIAELDGYALVEPDPFLALLKRHGNVAHLFFGHVHRSVHGSVSGVPFSAQRGLSAQFPLDLGPASATAVGAPPSYGVILVGPDSVVVHEEAFMTGWVRYDMKTGRPLATPSDAPAALA